MQRLRWKAMLRLPWYLDEEIYIHLVLVNGNFPTDLLANVTCNIL